MNRRDSLHYIMLSMVLDLLVILSSVQIARIVYLQFGNHQLSNINVLALYAVTAIAWLVISNLAHVYHPYRNYRAVDEFQRVIVANLVNLFIITGILFYAEIVLPRPFIVALFLFAMLGMLIWRSITRLTFRSLGGTQYRLRNILVVGANDVGSDVLNNVEKKQWMGLNIIGFADDDPELDYELLGGLDDVCDLVMEYNIDEVVIALSYDHPKIQAIIAQLHTTPVETHVVPNYFSIALHRAELEDWGDLQLINLRAPALYNYQRIVKRIFDFTAALLGLLVLWPIMLIIAYLIKRDSDGDALFIQERVGENGKLFRMFKFRTMYIDAEERLKDVIRYDDDGNIIHKMENDPRVTDIGRILRKTSLDELPQLWNVLKGEMSLVGPRPELPWLVEQYELWQHKRLSVPQGITGWWQINGRSDKPMHLHTEDDIYYIQNYSLLLDIFILWKTIAAVFKSEGAY